MWSQSQQSAGPANAAQVASYETRSHQLPVDNTGYPIVSALRSRVKVSWDDLERSFKTFENLEWVKFFGFLLVPVA